MNQQMNELDIVALLEDLPDEGLVAGQTGTIVLVHKQGEAFEVEFPVTERKYVVATVRRGILLKLQNLRPSRPIVTYIGDSKP